jgi:hypothetical protein
VSLEYKPKSKEIIEPKWIRLLDKRSTIRQLAFASILGAGSLALGAGYESSTTFKQIADDITHLFVDYNPTHNLAHRECSGEAQCIDDLDFMTNPERIASNIDTSSTNEMTRTIDLLEQSVLKQSLKSPAILDKFNKLVPKGNNLEEILFAAMQISGSFYYDNFENGTTVDDNNNTLSQGNLTDFSETPTLAAAAWRLDCDGAARLMTSMLIQKGVDAYIVTGIGYNYKTQAEDGHAFVAVEMDKQQEEGYINDLQSSQWTKRLANAGKEYNMNNGTAEDIYPTITIKSTDGITKKFLLIDPTPSYSMSDKKLEETGKQNNTGKVLQSFSMAFARSNSDLDTIAISRLGVDSFVRDHYNTGTEYNPVKASSHIAFISPTEINIVIPAANLATKAPKHSWMITDMGGLGNK